MLGIQILLSLATRLTDSAARQGKGNVKSEAFNLESDDKSSQKGDSSDRQFSSLLTKSLFSLALQYVS